MSPAAPTQLRARRIVVWSLPDLIPIALAAFSVVAMILLLMQQYRPALVLPVGVFAAAAAVWVSQPTASAALGSGTNPRDVRPLGIIGVLCVASAGVNGVRSGQYIYDWRDPATYGISGRWLVDHPSVLIPSTTRLFGHVPGLDLGSLGFGVLHDQSGVYPQGNHLLPALLAVPAWIIGPSAILHTNAVIGALALLALYGLARRLVGEWWGIIPPAALAASMPFLAFVRSTYSEPIALLFLVAGMALVIRAMDTGRAPDMAIAGLTLGCSALARVDSYVALLAVPICAGALCLAAGRDERRQRLVAAVALVVGATVPLVIGVLDLKRLSPGYWSGRAHETRLLGIGALVLLAIAAAVVAVAWRTSRPWFWVSNRRALSAVGSGAVVVGFAALASRPLWFTAHFATPDMSSTLATLQAGLGLTVDPTRSYDELSLSWMSWYFGWPTVALAVAGLALLVWRLGTRGDVRIVLPVAVTLALSALYFNRVLIYPDQVWAMRRFLPVVLPGMLIAAALALAVLWQRGRLGRITALVLGAVALIFPTVVSLPLVRVIEGDGQLEQVTAVCDALPADAALLAVDVEGARVGYLETFRAFCDVPTTGLPKPSPETLSAAAAAVTAQGRTLYVITTSADDVTWSAPPSTVGDVDLLKWPERLVDAPSTAVNFRRELFLGRVSPDGIAEPISPTD